MKLVIAGSRDLEICYAMIVGSLVANRLDCVTEIVSGGCPKGADLAAKEFPELNQMDDYPFFNHEIKYTEFSADWSKNGKAAGPIRNRQMAEYGDALLLIWDGKSRGSANMKKEMEKLKKPIYEVILKKPKKEVEL